MLALCMLSAVEASTSKTFYNTLTNISFDYAQDDTEEEDTLYKLKTKRRKTKRPERAN